MRQHWRKAWTFDSVRLFKGCGFPIRTAGAITRLMKASSLGALTLYQTFWCWSYLCLYSYAYRYHRARNSGCFWYLDSDFLRVSQASYGLFTASRFREKTAQLTNCEPIKKDSGREWELALSFFRLETDKVQERWDNDRHHRGLHAPYPQNVQAFLVQAPNVLQIQDTIQEWEWTILA